MLRTLPDRVCLKDQQGLYLFCNSRFERFFGAKEKDIIGKTDYDFVERELADFFRKHDQLAMDQEKPSKNEEEFVSAENRAEALDIAGKRATPVDLLLTDVVMPDMNGRELFEKISEKLPGLKVLYMSGYADNVIAHHGVLDPEVQFIQKPFPIQALAAKVREVLDGE